MRKLALLLSLLALGALGLVACGGGDDDEATAAPATPITDDGNPYDFDELAADPADNKSCGAAAGRGLTVVEGDISCREARRLMHRVAYNRLPYQWGCSGPEGATGGYEVCTNLPGASSRIVIKVFDPFVARHTVTEEGVPFSFRVPTVGWERFSSISTDKSAGGPISINKSIAGPQGAEAIIFWTSFPDGDYADPCARLLSPPVGSSAADLAAAVSAAPGTKLLTGPSNVTVGGRPAKHMALTVRENVGCDPGFFYTWRDVYGGALWPKTGVGDTIRVWIVDVDGTRLFIEAETTTGFSRDLEPEVQQIVESIRFNTRLSNAERIEQAGNEWAALFAEGGFKPGLWRYMGQPAGERMSCERVGNRPIKNCTPPSPEFRESFADATVERVVIEGHHATAEFSNGELVACDGQKADEGDKAVEGSAWFIPESWFKKIARKNFEP